MDHPGSQSEGRSSSPRFTSLRRHRSRRPRAPIVVGLVLLAAVVGGGIWYWTRFRTEPNASSPGGDRSSVAGDSTASRSAVGDSAFADLPALDSSDVLVRGLGKGLSSRPRVAGWLDTDDLVRRFVLAVANVAKGTNPTSRLGFMAPKGAFAVRSTDGRTVIDSASYHRYDALTDAFISLDTDGVARLYHRIEPLCDRAYRELGLSGGTFEDALSSAFGRLLAVQVPGGPIEVTPAGALYAFEDSALEALSPAAKHLLRMGPANADRVQAKLRELAGAMGVRPTER